MNTVKTPVRHDKSACYGEEGMLNGPTQNWCEVIGLGSIGT